MFRAALLLLPTLCLLAQSPAKTQKLSEIDSRISTLRAELDGLTALRAAIVSGQLPDSALAAIQVCSTAVTPAQANAIATSSISLVALAPSRAVTSTPNVSPSNYSTPC